MLVEARPPLAIEIQACACAGHFALAIPGGSVLKMLAKSSPKWAGQTTLAFVNHKAVPVDDESLSTLAKARKLFLSEWEALGCNVVPLDGSSDAEAEAAAYQSKLQSLAQGQLPRVNASAGEELAVFDLMLIGVGDDGHIGSLYPDRPEVLDTTGRWVLPVSKKSPGSITLSLPLMLAARQVVVAACGVSDKYPKGKSDAMARAIEEDVSPASFPAAALRARADWVLDVAAAGKLSFDYAQCFTFRSPKPSTHPSPSTPHLSSPMHSTPSLSPPKPTAPKPSS